MAIAKIILNGVTQMDVTQKTVTAEDMLSGVTALRNDGTDITGSITNMTLPSASSSTSSGTAKATITPTSSAQYLNIPVGYNGTAQYYTIAASGGGGSKNIQTNQTTDRRSNTALGSINSLTCSTSGTYDVYWTCARSNTSQTWGSQLYIDGTAYGTENTTWSNNVQNNHLTGVSISANQTVAVYGRSRNGYYIYAPQLTIVQTA